MSNVHWKRSWNLHKMGKVIPQLKLTIRGPTQVAYHCCTDDGGTDTQGAYHCYTDDGGTYTQGAYHCYTDDGGTDTQAAYHCCTDDGDLINRGPTTAPQMIGELIRR